MLGLSKSIGILCCFQDVKSRLQVVVQGKSSINETFVEEVILTRAAAGIANRLRSVIHTFWLICANESHVLEVPVLVCSLEVKLPTNPPLPSGVTLQWRQAYRSFCYGGHNHGDGDTSTGEQRQQTGEWHLKNYAHNHRRATHKRTTARVAYLTVSKNLVLAIMPAWLAKSNHDNVTFFKLELAVNVNFTDTRTILIHCIVTNVFPFQGVKNSR